MVHLSGSLSRLRPSAGIALGPILFILAVLAVLAGAIAAGSGGFNANITTDSAKVMAQTIIQESEQVQNTAQMLMANGCTESQMNFYSIGYLGANPSAPIDHHCDVFDARGGNLIFMPLQSSFCSNIGSCIVSISDGNVIPGIGTGVPQAIWMAYYLTSAVCQQINSQLGRATTTPTATAIAGINYTGTFPVTQTLNAAYTGVTAACVGQGGGVYIFYRVLWTR